MLSRERLLDIITLDENSGVEFKLVVVHGKTVKEPKRDDLSDEIAAFANQEGGIILFGVEDKTKIVVGLDGHAIHALTRYVSEICHDSIKPPLVHFYISAETIVDGLGDAKQIVYMEIDKSLWLHESKGGYFYRHGENKRKMSTEHILRVGQSRSQARIIPFDEQVVPNTSRDTLDQNLYQRFIRIEGGDEGEVRELLIKRRLLKAEGTDYKATVAAILMCHHKPDDHLRNSFIRAVCYKGLKKDANYQIDAKDIHGPLDRQIVDAFNFAKKHASVSARKELMRVDYPQYSPRAIFEAIVNAVIHRDYSKSGSKIRLFMFSDRLELYSPGALANTLTIDALQFNQVTRNELLARLLSEVQIDDSINSGRARFLEQRGEGVQIILSESQELSNKLPEYSLINEELCLTIYAHKVSQNSE